MSVIAGFMVPHPPLIVPKIGRGGEAVIEETTVAYRKTADMIAALKPDTIVLSSPHTVLYADYFHISPGGSASGDFRAFGAPEVRFDVAYDEGLAFRIAAEAALDEIDAGLLGEKDASLDHGTMVPLHFIMEKYTDFKLVRIGLSGFSLSTHYRMGQAIKRAAEDEDRRCVYVASGDLSHRLKEDGPYGYNPAGPKYDERIMDVMGRCAFDELMDFEGALLDEAAECGHRSFVMMAGALDDTALSADRFSHQDVTGVGYGICSYVETGEYERLKDELEAIIYGGEREDQYHTHMSIPATQALMIWEKRNDARLSAQRSTEDPFVRLARASLESYIKEGKTINWKEVEDEILKGFAKDGKNITEENIEKIKSQLEKERAGAFVSIHKEGSLRGCIGTISAVRKNIAEEIIENAISASSKDPRFNPIMADELPYLEITVDILGDKEPIESPDDLDVKKYGVIVTKGMHRGLLLPNLDGVDTVEEQLSIAKQKAGLSPYEDECLLERFEVVRHY